MRRFSTSLVDICHCGHTGGSQGKQHGSDGPMGVMGYGSCLQADCSCRRFKWKRAARSGF